MIGIVLLFYWLFGRRLLTLGFVGYWVELGLGAEMRNSMIPHSNEYSLGSARACEPRSRKPPGVAKQNKIQQ